MHYPGAEVLVTRHTSRVTRHTSHVTRHTSHVTRHTPLSWTCVNPANKGSRLKPLVQLSIASAIILALAVSVIAAACATSTLLSGDSNVLLLFHSTGAMCGSDPARARRYCHTLDRYLSQSLCRCDRYIAASRLKISQIIYQKEATSPPWQPCAGLHFLRRYDQKQSALLQCWCRPLLHPLHPTPASDAPPRYIS